MMIGGPWPRAPPLDPPLASGSARTRLQVSVYTGYDLCHPGFPKMFLSVVTPLTPKSQSSPRQLLHPCHSCTHGANLVTAGQLLSEIMQI